METPCWCPSTWAVGRKPGETSVTEFCYKSVNLSLKELKNVTIILYSNTRTVQIVEFPEISHLLNQHHSSLARHVNATSRKSLEIQARSITKPRTYSECHANLNRLETHG